jgi:signal transduction histidine kinase
VAEGLSRVIDQLGQNFIPNVHEKNPIDPDGTKLGLEDRDHYELKKKMRHREQRLSRLLSQLNEIQRMDEGLTESEESLKIFKDLEPYKLELDERLAEVRKQILETEITLEISRDNELKEGEENGNHGQEPGKTLHK